MKKIKKLLVLALLISSTAIIFSNNDTSAVMDSGTLNKFKNNNILFYDPTCSITTTYTGSIHVSGNTIDEKVWTALTSFMSPEQAAGIMGNMVHEGNSFNPVQHEVSQLKKYQPGFDIENDTRYPYGIGLIQWSKERRVGMLQHIKSADPSLMTYFNQYDTYSVGYDINGAKFLELVKEKLGEAEGNAVVDKLIALEIEYLQMEMNHSKEMQLSGKDWKEYFNINDVTEAATYFLYNVEAPANPEDSKAKRIADAQVYYEKFKDLAVNTTSKVPSGDNIISKTAKDLAWVDKEVKDLKPEFVAAAKEVGTDYGTPDCGKFVATVILKSGVDSSFPKSYTGSILRYALSSDLWREIHPSSVSELVPGDLFVYNIEENGVRSSGHTFLYVGNGQVAEASLNDFYGRVAAKDLTPYINGTSGKPYHIFRLASIANTYGGSCSTQVLKDGGFSSAAEGEALIAAYKKADLSSYGLPMPDSGDYHDNCVAFSNWFIINYTKMGHAVSGDGRDIASSLVSTYSSSFPGLAISHTPSVYSVASWKSAAAPNTSSGNHTGIVVGINQATDTILIAEAAWNLPKATGIHKYSLSVMSGNPDFEYVNVNQYLKTTGDLK